MRDALESAIDSLATHFTGYVQGTRPIHSPGIAATGWFEANPAARRYCEAQPFAGRPVPVIVRFSNGTGTHGQPDAVPTVRGIAVKFLLGDVTTDEHGVPRGELEADMIGMTLPVFFVATFDRFGEFMRAAAPVPVPRLTPWQKLRQAVRLETPPRPPNPGDAALNEFADRYPPARLGLFAASVPCRPLSYATATYHGVHAFWVTAGGVRRAARFHWEPVAGVRTAGPEVEGDYLRAELGDRLCRERIQFVLRMVLAEQGDDPSDSTAPWPGNRRRVTMGDLWIEALVPDQLHGNELLVFNPGRLVDGIAASGDEILEARSAIYARSAARRFTDRGIPPPIA